MTTQQVFQKIQFFLSHYPSFQVRIAQTVTISAINYEEAYFFNLNLDNPMDTKSTFELFEAWGEINSVKFDITRSSNLPLSEYSVVIFDPIQNSQQGFL